MSNSIKILDCTLRDGGYANEWLFGEKNIKSIMQNLISSNADIIECGFLKPIIYNPNKTLFSCIEDLKHQLPPNIANKKFTLMINFGEVDKEDISACNDPNIALRIVFKKAEITEALDYCNKLKKKGYEIFINPMHTNSYSMDELKALAYEVNKIAPSAFTITDTTGSMSENDVLNIFETINKNLSADISLCFHSHNNLQLSFANAKTIINVCKNRNLIIDSTVFGMGRCAGNLCTELIMQYLNDNYNKNYNILPILKIINTQISPIYPHTPWGYSIPYYLSAINHCHPNYAKFLSEKNDLTLETIDILLKKIPKENKSIFDKELINKIYSDISSIKLIAGKI